MEFGSTDYWHGDDDHERILRTLEMFEQFFERVKRLSTPERRLTTLLSLRPLITVFEDKIRVLARFAQTLSTEM